MTLNSDLAKTYFSLGFMYQQRGQLEAAIENYHLAIEYQPDYIAAYSNLGAALLQEKEFAAAEAIYQKALVLNPQQAKLYNNLGQVFQLQGKQDLALKYFRQAIELDPNMEIAHYNLGRIWWQKQNYLVAAASFQKVIARKPENIMAYVDCGTVLMAYGQIEEALGYFREAIARERAFITIYCNRAQQIAPKDLLDLAQISIAKFLVALLEKQDFSVVCQHLWQSYLYLGDVAFEYGKNKQAARYYQNALKINHQNPELYLRLGNCLALQERTAAAVIVYHLGLKLQPHQPQILLQLGKLLEQQKQLLQAIEYYEKLFELQLTGKASLTPTPRGNPPPQLRGIYLATKDWFNATALEGVKYIEVCWGTKDPKSYENQSPKETRGEDSTLIPIVSHSTSKQELSQCGGVICGTCMNNLCKSFEATQVQPGVHLCSENKRLTVEDPRTFVVEIPAGRAWIAPQTNSYLICKEIAIVTPDNYLLGELSRFYPWYLPGCQKHDPSNHPLLRVELLPEPEKIYGNVAICASLSAQVYYHWVIDVLPRIGILQQSGIKLKEIDWWVVNSIEKKYQIETLKALGIPLEKVIASDRHPHLVAQNLIVPSFAGHLDWPGWGTIQFLRENFLGGKAGNYPEKIYISRAKAKYRQVINEAEVLEILRENGFTTVLLEEMTFAEQVGLFAAAKIIVTPHGAGMTNLVFCSQGTQVVEFFSPRYLRTDYWIITQQLGLKHYYLIGENFQCHPIRQLMYRSPLTEDILVPLNSLKAVLKLL
ncbi:MAG: DUF563 domain-containing protein [Gomphosphaeria aponina SAG 52.96 = DSM 107014]|uniref:DUF563 domain-containing protein n=1 Tax=Gomphosphaeria aponina SAG 52.96 = DSM 107014 TaxID=1521640 RepID=A0A941GP45_9CHRO|nr:DUF563 domain-containing protein [Gomphosphaeria aponina SAG 52.96 = DSM 107014]